MYEYSEFVEKTRAYISKGIDRETAVDEELHNQTLKEEGENILATVILRLKSGESDETLMREGFKEKTIKLAHELI